MRIRFFSIAAVVAGSIGLQLAWSAPNPALDNARSKAKAGKWDEVQGLAADAVAADPNSDEGWRLRGRAELFLGDTTAAVQYLEQALTLNPKQADAIIDLTSVYVAMNQLENADRVVAAAEKKDPKGKLDEIKVSRALILGKQGKIGEATPILASATARHPDNPVYPLMLARIYDNANVPELAADNFDKAWDLDEGNPDIAFEYGNTLLELKQYDEADRLFRIVQDRDPENKQVDYLRGRLRFAAKRFAEAAAEFEKAVDKNPESFLPNYWLGRSYLDLSKAEKKNFYGAAIEPLRLALRLKPERKDISLSLAESEYFVGRTIFATAGQDSMSQESRTRLADEFAKQAAGYDANAVPRQPVPPTPPIVPGPGEVVPPTPGEPVVSDVDRVAEVKALAARFRSAEAALRAPDARLDDKNPLRRELYELAIAAMLHAISDEPDLAKQQDVYAYVARAYDKLGNPEAALTYTDKQLALAPNSQSDITRKVSLLQRTDNQAQLAAYLGTLAADSALFAKYGMILVNSYIETSQYDSARATVKRVITADPGNCDAHQLNAYIDLKRERYGAAISALLDGVKACPNNADLWVYLGDSYYFSNEKDKATVQRAKDAYCRAGSLGSPVGREKCEQIGEILKTLK